METRLLAPLVALALSACAPSTPEVAPSPIDDGPVRIDEGSPEALGLLAFLNDERVDESFLDHAVALDSRAARSLAHHRNGPDGQYPSSDDDPFDSVAEVDSVYYVGPAAIDTLLRYAEDHGFVASGDDHLGTFDGVDFTVDEAELTVELANTATRSLLDYDLALDSRAVDSIVEARTITSVQQLSELYYVGESALTVLKNYALGGSVCELDPLYDLADAVSRGDGAFTVLVNDEVDWEAILDGRYAPGTLTGARCFGLSSDQVPEGAELSEWLAEPEELVANLSEVSFLARVDPSEGVDALECETKDKRFFGCQLSFEAESWSGIDQHLFVSTDERFVILFEAAWYE